jgi:hypothetical protein
MGPAPQKLLANSVRQPNLLTAELLVDPQPLPQPDELRAERTHWLEAMTVRAQRIGQNQGVSSIVLRSAHRVPVPVPVDLLRVDRVDGNAVLQEAIHHRTMRCFDGDRDRDDLCLGQLEQPLY